jgi:hypothetical protein
VNLHFSLVRIKQWKKVYSHPPSSIFPSPISISLIPPSTNPPSRLLGQFDYLNIKNSSAFRNNDRQDDRMTGWQTGWQTEDPRWIYDRLVGFGRACAPVRCAHPSFLGSLTCKKGRCAPPPPPIAAPLLLIHHQKINNNYFMSGIRKRDACVKGFPVKII